MQADHLFQSLPSAMTEMKDVFSIAAPVSFQALRPPTSVLDRIST